jgi:hypothetical protein
MYRTASGEEIFVIDGHTHFWDGSPANQKNIHGKQFIECFYAYHSNLSPPSEKWTLDKFSKYDAKTMHDDLFVHGYDDSSRPISGISTRTGSTRPNATPR